MIRWTHDACAAPLVSAANPTNPCRLFGSLSRSNTRDFGFEPPKFLALKRDFPKMRDPLKLISDMTQRRESWNALHPHDLDNFPMPTDFSGAVDRALLSLDRIKAPKELAREAAKIHDTLIKLRRRGQPFRDTLASLNDATFLIRKKYPSPLDLAESANETHRLAEILPRSVQTEIQNIWSTVDERDFPQALRALNVDPKRQMDWINDLRTKTLQKIRAYLYSPAGSTFLEIVPTEVARLQSEAERLKALGGVKDLFDRDQALRKINQLETLRAIRRERIDYFDRHPMALLDLMQPTPRSSGVDISDALGKTWLFPSGRPPSIEGRAEAFLLGGKPIEVRRTADFDGQTWANSHETFARSTVSSVSRVGAAIQSLPLSERLAVQASIESLPQDRSQHLARFAIFLTSKPASLDLALQEAQVIPQSLPHAFQQAYKQETTKTITTDEAQWLADWFQSNVLSRISLKP